MFKSVFAKYVTAVMTIFVVGFTVLLVVLTSIVSNTLSEGKTDEMEDVGKEICGYVESAVGATDADCFIDRFSDALSNPALRLTELFRALTVTDSDLNILVADSQGVIRYRMTGGHEEQSLEAVLPESLLESGNADGSVQAVVNLPPLFSSEVLVLSMPVTGNGGETVGYVAVSSSLAPNGRMMRELAKTAVSSALLVLLAVMIAVYFISERVTSPLREMSSAAKKFADGKFDARVTVYGCDEVAELAVAFNQMAESLENLEKMRSSFIANVSHDLRTPMTTIAGFIEGIRDGVIPPEEQNHYLEVISMEVQRLSRLVSSLLDLSRIQAGDRKFTPKPFDICEMARLILISFEQKIEEKKLNVEFECEDDRMTVYADHDAIYQIFYNICHNAVKFSTVGGTFQIRICNLEHKVQISVFNEGQGIAQEDLPYVFERFYKSDKSRGLDKSGVGLGLFISKTIVEAHGEKIWVTSETGKNCEFFFTMPKPPRHLSE